MGICPMKEGRSKKVFVRGSIIGVAAYKRLELGIDIGGT